MCIVYCGSRFFCVPLYILKLIQNTRLKQHNQNAVERCIYIAYGYGGEKKMFEKDTNVCPHNSHDVDVIRRLLSVHVMTMCVYLKSVVHATLFHKSRKIYYECIPMKKKKKTSNRLYSSFGYYPNISQTAAHPMNIQDQEINSSIFSMAQPIKYSN